MSTSIENLRRLSKRDMKEHTAVFDSYVCLGRDVEYIAIRFGIDPMDVINLLEGYGERITGKDELDFSGQGRLKSLSRLLVEEYVEKFYPGISSENPQNDWICIEAYLERFHSGWRNGR